MICKIILLGLAGLTLAGEPDVFQNYFDDTIKEVDIPLDAAIKGCLQNGNTFADKVKNAYADCFGSADYDFGDLAAKEGSKDSDNDGLPDSFENNEQCFYKKMGWVNTAGDLNPDAIKGDLVGLESGTKSEFDGNIDKCASWNGDFGSRRKREAGETETEEEAFNVPSVMESGKSALGWLKAAVRKTRSADPGQQKKKRAKKNKNKKPRNNGKRKAKGSGNRKAKNKNTRRKRKGGRRSSKRKTAKKNKNQNKKRKKGSRKSNKNNRRKGRKGRRNSAKKNGKKRRNKNKSTRRNKAKNKNRKGGRKSKKRRRNNNKRNNKNRSSDKKGKNKGKKGKKGGKNTGEGNRKDPKKAGRTDKDMDDSTYNKLWCFDLSLEQILEKCVENKIKN